MDLMLVHFPATWAGKGGKKMRLETWKAMEAFHKAGKVRLLAFPMVDMLIVCV